MKQTRLYIYKAIILALPLLWGAEGGLLVGCSNDSLVSDEGGERVPMEFATEYPVVQTRATDAGFESGDQMGIFVTGLAQNVAFTYDEAAEKWSSNVPLYWPRGGKAVDVVGYYPYDSNVSDASAYSFAISTHQDKDGAYEASDLLCAKAEGVTAAAGKVMLTYRHIMAGMKIGIERGEGFEDTEWNESEKQAYVLNAATACIVNVNTGSIGGKSGSATVIPVTYRGDFRAVLVPTTYKAGTAIIGIQVNGQEYKLTKSDDLTLASGKMYSFTVKVDKHADSGDYVFSLNGESVSPWLDDPDFHDGIVRQYITVHVKEPGTFVATLKDMGLDYTAISSLKVSGRVNDDDLYFMGRMPVLSNLNMKDMIIDNEGDDRDDVIADSRFRGTPLLHLVLPDRLKRIGYLSFGETSLTGTVVFPEGLEVIEAWAFGQTYETPAPAGFHAVFPSTLKVIGASAFMGNGVHSCVKGELVLPEGLVSIGEEAFWNGNQIIGRLVLPETLEYIGYDAFYGARFTGDLVIPGNIKCIPLHCFTGARFDGNLIIGEGVERIMGGAFDGSSFKGELALPSTVKEIGMSAFEGNKFTSVVLPEKLQLLGNKAFADCENLMGEIVVPPNIVDVPDGCFSNCPLITSVKLHKNVRSIGRNAFGGDTHISTVVCDNPEPPLLDEQAFYNVVKSKITVEVPKEGLAAYKRDRNWSEFSRLTEFRNFVCRPATACALGSEHTQTLVLNADGQWRLEHKPDWVSVSPSHGNKKTNIMLTFDALASGDRSDSLVFALEGSDALTYCALSQYAYEHSEDEMLALQKHSKGMGINIYFVGDGWDAASIASGEYLNLCRQYKDYFFGLPPYDRLSEYFDVYAVMALSQQTGVNTMNVARDTRFATLYSAGSDGCGGYAPSLIPNEGLVFDYITSLTGHRRGEWFQIGELWRDLIVLIPNTTDYSGITYYYDDGSTICLCPPSTRAYPNDTRGCVQHEVGGHGFGKLGDEGIARNAYAPQVVRNQIQEYHRRGWYRNLSITGIMSNVPWSDFIFNPKYSNDVDVFEGGAGYTRWVWRSEAASCMGLNYIPYYNAISRYSIARRVMELSGSWFDYASMDTNEWGRTE